MAGRITETGIQEDFSELTFKALTVYLGFAADVRTSCSWHCCEVVNREFTYGAGNSTDFWPDHAPAVYDQPDIYLPVPEFARDFQLTVAELFSWLR